jgi:hypothetical protein
MRLSGTEYPITHVADFRCPAELLTPPHLISGSTTVRVLHWLTELAQLYARRSSVYGVSPLCLYEPL